MISIGTFINTMMNTNDINEPTIKAAKASESNSLSIKMKDNDNDQKHPPDDQQLLQQKKQQQQQEHEVLFDDENPHTLYDQQQQQQQQIGSSTVNHPHPGDTATPDASQPILSSIGDNPLSPIAEED